MALSAATRYSLVRRLADRSDARAWDEFVAIYEPFLAAIARRHGLQDADAADLCQEVFSSLAARVGDFEPTLEAGSFRAWLFRVAKNRVLDFLDRQKRVHRGTGRTSIHDRLAEVPQREVKPAELDAELRRRIFQWAAASVRDEFQAATWQAFWKTGIENQPAAATAKLLGLSIGAVYVAKSRVLARIKEKVERVALETGFFAWEGVDA